MEGKEMLEKILNKLEGLETKVDKLETGQQEIKKGQEIIQEAVAENRELIKNHTHTTGKMEMSR